MIVSVNSKPDLLEFKNLMLKTDRVLNEDAKKGILTECLRNYKNIDDSLALEISNDILLTSNKAEINRYGARALKKIAKNKILNLQTNKNFSSIS